MGLLLFAFWLFFVFPFVLIKWVVVGTFKFIAAVCRYSYLLLLLTMLMGVITIGVYALPFVLIILAISGIIKWADRRKEETQD